MAVVPRYTRGENVAVSSPAVEFRVLGAVEVSVGVRSVAVGHARQRQVLAALLVDANRPVPADTLRERVWGERTPQGYRARCIARLPELARQFLLRRGPFRGARAVC
jgi:hypothetical protein